MVRAPLTTLAPVATLAAACVLVLCGWSTPVGSEPGVATPRGKRACKPDCRKKRCGGDGCGGLCGSCPTGKSCHRDRCVNRPKDPCARMYGTWKGAMYLKPTHNMQGKIWGTRHACFGRFRITYPLSGGVGSADENFTITFSGKRVSFKGTRIIRSSPRSSYVLDNFSGAVNYRRGRFTGVFKNRTSATGPVILVRK